MPTALYGYTRNESINLIMSIVGSNNAQLSGYIQTCFSNWQNEFFQLHDWNWSHNTARSTPSPILTTVIGQRSYALNFGTPQVLNSNIESIVCITTGGGRKLFKVNTQDIRAADPEGIQQGRPIWYSMLDMGNIEFWPVPNIAEQFVIEGRFEPDFIDPNVSDTTLQIPYKYQGYFIQYILIKSKQFLRDQTWKDEAALFSSMLKNAIAEDNRNLEENFRIKTVNEQIQQPGVWDINTQLWWTGYP